MSSAIYQIMGKPDSYKEAIYKIGEWKTQDKLKLSSEALYQYCKEYDEIVLLCPYSLRNYKEDISNLVSDKSIPVRLMDIHAIGQYDKIYVSNPTNISLQIFCDMLSKDRVLCDISTGHNIYSFSLIEAARFYISYKRLLKGELDLSVDVKYSISEPIIRESQEANIFLDKLRARTTFSLPPVENITSYIEDADDNYKKKIGREYIELSSNIKELYKELKKAYHAIRYNAPLTLYDDLINFDIDVDVSKLISFCNDVLKIKEDGEKVCSRSLERGIFNVFLALALYNGIKQIRESLTKDTCYYGEGMPLNILEGFKDIYKKLDMPLNIKFLEKDTKEIRDRLQCISEEWKSYDEVYKEESDIKRNFFAHSGFERTVLEVKKENDKILLQYKGERKNEVKAWIKDPQ